MTPSCTTAARCQTCGRPLRAAKSVAAQRGPRCAARIRAAAREIALAGFTPRQIDAALEAISDGAVILLRAGIYRVVSSDGHTAYSAHYSGCTCPAGTLGLGRACWHKAAVRILGLSATRSTLRKAA